MYTMSGCPQDRLTSCISTSITSLYGPQMPQQWLLVAWRSFSFLCLPFSKSLSFLFLHHAPLAPLAPQRTFPAFLSRAIHAVMQGNEKTNGACHSPKGCLSPQENTWSLSEAGMLGLCRARLAMNGSAVISLITGAGSP